MAKPVCVLFLLDWRPVFWSTREEYHRQLCRALSNRGIAPILTVSEQISGDVRQRFEEVGAQVVACSYHAHPWAYWMHIRRVVRRYQVQIVHVRFFDYFTAVFWLCRWSGIRNVFFTEANSGEWNGRGWRAALVRLRTRAMCEPLTKAIGISSFVRDRLVKVGIPAKHTCVIYNGVDLERFRADSAARESIRRQAGAKKDSAVLIFAASLVSWKRPELAVRVCAALAARGMDVRLWVAGDGPLRPGLEALAKELDISNRVSWLGHQTELAAWYVGADLFLHTAVGEAFGNVLIEAMACGLPVVATASGAVSELVVDGEMGRLIAPGPREIDDLAKAAGSVLENRERYAAMSEAAIRQARRFPVEASVAETLEVYAPFLAD